MPVDFYSKSHSIYARQSPADQLGLYEAIKREYLNLEPKDNPPKTGIQLTFDDSGKSPTSFMNIMASRISTGHYGTKTIMCDMAAGKTVAITMIFDTDNHLVAVLDSAELTAIRCAHMAVLSVDLFTHMRYPLTQFRYGFIGTGVINQKTAWLLHDAFGVSDFIVRGHPQRIAKNIEKFPPGTRIAGSISALSTCEAVFVATTETLRSGQISTAHFKKLPILFVAQDTGCLLDESFRQQFESFTDNVDQLAGHWADCFPWDSKSYQLRSNHGLGFVPKACVYLYGMAFSDVIVAAHTIGLLK